MDLDLQAELEGIADLRHRIRRLGTFRASFRRCADLMTMTRGITFDICDRRLSAAFLDWAEIFERERPLGRQAPRDFAVFAGGLMARELLRQKFGEMIPVSSPAKAASAANDNCVASFWPAGFLVMSYCASVLNSVVAQGLGPSFTLHPAARDLRVWWAFRDSVAKDATRAIGYFELFLGRPARWSCADRFEATVSGRPAQRATVSGLNPLQEEV